jgi:CRISPR-associated protein Csx3
MGRFFTAAITAESDGVVTLTIGFGEPAANTQVVPDAIAALAALKLSGGQGIHFNGPASLPAAMALAHSVAHLYGYVACYDPKLKGYIVAISHDPGFRPGQLLPAAAGG